VITKVGGSCEAFVADITRKWPIACVGHHVLLQVGNAREHFVTDIAFVALALGMAAHVSLH
jgi:hypothetical protein